MFQPASTNLTAYFPLKPMGIIMLFTLLTSSSMLQKFCFIACLQVTVTSYVILARFVVSWTRLLFKPGTRSLQPHVPDFLKFLWFARQYVCVCLPPRALITSGVIWHDIGRVQLVKQISRLFPAFNYILYMTLAINKMNGCGHINTAVMNVCQRKLRWYGTNYKWLPERWSTSFIKVGGWMRSD